MKINDANKTGASETIQSQSPSAPATPKVLTGVGSARDVFESSKTSSELMESLAYAFKQSVSENNEDKKYYLQKLQDHNQAANALAEELKRLVEKSEQLSAMEHGKEEEEEKGPVIIGKANDGAAVKEAFKKDENPFQLKIVKRD